MSGMVGAFKSVKCTTVLLNRDLSWYFLMKRRLNFSITAVLVTLFSPIMAVTAILITFDSSTSGEGGLKIVRILESAQASLMNHYQREVIQW